MADGGLFDDDTEFEDEVLLFLLLMRRNRRRYSIKERKRKTWAKPWILKHREQGIFSNLVHELSGEDPEKFRQFHRLDRDLFDEILARVDPLDSQTRYNHEALDKCK